ncbi:MAG: cell division protein ZipA C-terminal FtsZ-binding domain-containing protein [Zoogloeaceae bacterium]|jgi:FtsZ-interacting cell division protein ZipA|nr:cell division protein ZipA C-terminal FtsZ-binding domain-containing protein [Zoogloeaceae bacterium]
MDTLQLGIGVVGAVVVAGIIAHGKWQERAQKKMTERLFQKPGEDVLFHQSQNHQDRPAAPADGNDSAGRRRHGGRPDRREPTLPPEAEDDLPEEPTLLATAGRTGAEDKTPARLNPPLPAALLLPGVDAIAVIELAEALPASQITASQWHNMRRLKKPVRWVGFNEARGIWEEFDPEARARYRHLRIGLQLVDRRGPARDGDFHAFSAAMQQLADEHKVTAELPDAQTALEQARQLDQFCVEVDLQIGVNLVSRDTAFPGAKIHALAKAVGMTLATEGIYIRANESGQTLFILQNLEADGFTPETMPTLQTHGLIFLFDVPHVPRGQQAYQQMVEIARRFAETLDGILVDDNRQPLDEAQFGRICQEFVIHPQAALEAAGLPPGGPLAQRIFSVP